MIRRHYLIVLTIAASMATNAYCHDKETHRNITRAAVAYLKAKAPEFACFDEEFVQIGTVHEDDGKRPIFHFSPALTDLGASASCDSIAWGLTEEKPRCTSLPYNDTNIFTWPAAKNHAKTDETMMPSAEGWKDLGYVLHLLQDLTSPAHVRNDGHLYKNFLGKNVGDLDPLEKFVRIPAMPTEELLPFTTPEEFFTNLSTWTRNNFFSKDTVFTTPLPEASSENNKYFFDAEGNKLAAKERNYRGSLSLVNARSKAEITETIAEEQFSRLGPQAVLYTASFMRMYYQTTGAAIPGACLSEVPGNAPLSYLPAQFAGLSVPNERCGPQRLPGQITFSPTGEVDGSGCFSPLHFPVNAAYRYSQGPEQRRANLELFLPNTNLGPVIRLGKTSSTPGIAATVSDRKIPVTASWQSRNQNGEALTIDPTSRIRTGLNFIANKNCRALQQGIEVLSNNAHLEVAGSTFSLKEGEKIFASAAVDELGAPELLIFKEDYGNISNVGERGFSMSVARPGTIPGLSSVIISLNDITIPTVFQFQASMRLPAGSSTLISCQSP